MSKKAEVIRLVLEQELTGSEIAVYCDVSRQYVFQIAGEIGVKPYRRPARTKEVCAPKPVDPMRDQRRKYKDHKRQAERRGIEFLLSFDEWWSLWEPHYHNRGRGKGQMCMCRTLDQGPYAIGNVRIDLVQSNGHDKVAARRAKGYVGWGQTWMKKRTGMHLPNPLMSCQQEDVEEDPFVYYN